MGFWELYEMVGYVKSAVIDRYVMTLINSCSFSGLKIMYSFNFFFFFFLTYFNLFEFRHLYMQYGGILSDFWTDIVVIF